MKRDILKWLSLVLALVAVGFAIWAFPSAVGMFGTSGYTAVALLVVSLVFIAGGGIMVCVGAFASKRTVALIGAIVLAVGVALIFVSRSINISHLYG